MIVFFLLNFLIVPPIPKTSSSGCAAITNIFIVSLLQRKVVFNQDKEGIKEIAINGALKIKELQLVIHMEQDVHFHLLYLHSFHVEKA